MPRPPYNRAQVNRESGVRIIRHRSGLALTIEDDDQTDDSNVEITEESLEDISSSEE